MTPTYDFPGQVALVTGAGSGMARDRERFVLGVALPVDGGYVAH